MKHLLIYGPKQQNRQEILLEELSEYFDADSRRLNAMIFAPTRRKAAELKSRILAYFERKCWMPEVMTFSQFMESHYGEVLSDRQLLSPYARLLVINHLLRGGQLGYLEKAQLSYGLSQKISEVLEHLQASLLVGEERNQLIQQLAAESTEKAKTVESFDRAYHRFLEEQRLADENILNFELLLKWQKNGYSVESLKEISSASLYERRETLIKKEQFAKVLVLDEFAFFTELEKAVFHAIVPFFQKVILTLATPLCFHRNTFLRFERNSLLAFKTKAMETNSEDWRAFKTHRGYESIQSIVDWLSAYDWEEREAPSESEHLPEIVAERLFLNQPFARIPAEVGKKDFRLIAAPNRREEVRTVARLIRQSLPKPDDGRIVVDLREFVVVCSDLTIYQSLIEEVFSEYRLPVKISRGYPLRQIPFIALLKKILTCVLTNRWTRPILFDIFSAGWIEFAPEISIDEIVALTDEDFPTDFSPEPFDIHRIDSLEREAGVQQDFDIIPWFGKIRSYLERKIPPVSEFGTRNSEFKIENTETDDEQMVRAKEHAQVASDLLTIQKFIRHAKILIQAKSAVEFKNMFGQFIELMFFPKSNLVTSEDRSDEPRFSDLMNGRMEERKEKWENGFQLQAVSLQLIEIINEMVKTFRVLGSRDNNAEDYIEYIAMAISSTELSEEQIQQFAQIENENAVQVISPLETGGLSFENLFIVGLVEGEYPSRPIANFLISPDESQPLPIATLDPLPRERFFFQQMIGNSQRVVLTYPKMVDGKELAPSPFVEDVRTLFEFPKGDKANEIAPLDESEKVTLLSEQEVLKQMGELNTIVGSENLRVPYANLQTQLNIEQAREQLHAFSIYDGHLNGKCAMSIRSEYELPAFCYSVSQLEDYAQCPMKFFFKYVLALEDLEVAESEIAPNEKGTLVHKILERFGKRQRWEHIDIEKAHTLMPQIAQEEIQRYDEQFPDLYWEEEKRRLVSRLTNPNEPKGILKAFLEVEFESPKELLDGNFKPKDFEYKFGNFQGGTSQSLALQIPRVENPDIFSSAAEDGEGDKPPINIRGVIDRVDIDEEYQRFAVYDYKTGGYANIRKIERGISFQLPIYLQAVSRDEYNKTPAAGAYYVLKKVKDLGKKGYLGVWDALKDEYKYKKGGDIKKPPSGFYFAEDFQRLKVFVIENIKSIDKYIRSGKFNPSIWEERDAMCQWCKYKFICRYNASRQLNMKSQGKHYHPKRFSI